MTKPIRIRLISEYLVVSVNLGQLRRDSFMRSYWGPEWLSFLRYWTALKPKHKKLLIVSWEDTTAGQSSKGMRFQKMLSEAGSLGWMVKVRIPGDTDGTRRHLAMSGYLQCGEAVCMKLATRYFFSLLPLYDAKLVNFVHDEWVVECRNSLDRAVELAKIMADSLTKVGEDLKLNCPLAGSYWNEDRKDYTVGMNWYEVH